MAKSRLKYKIWERLVVFLCLILIFLSVYLNVVYYDLLDAAFESHNSALQIGSFIRALSYTSKESIKYGFTKEYPTLNLTNYLDRKYYQIGLIQQYSIIFRQFLQQIIDFSHNERVSIMSEDIGSRDSCRHSTEY